MNDAKLIGRLTRDPELRTSTQGNPYVHFTLAVNRRFRKKKEDGQPDSSHPTADFIPCVAWKGFATSIAKGKKGTRISVSGPLQSRNFKGTDGKMKTLVEVRVTDFEFMDKKPKDNTPIEDVEAPTPADFNGTPVDDAEMDIY